MRINDLEKVTALNTELQSVRAMLTASHYFVTAYVTLEHKCYKYESQPLVVTIDHTTLQNYLRQREQFLQKTLTDLGVDLEK